MAFRNIEAVFSGTEFDCFQDIIGITQTTCECYENIPEPISRSGLYLDELEGLESLSSLANCEDGNIWEVGAKAISRAITLFKADTNALLLSRYKEKQKKYSGLLGWTKTKHIRNLNSNCGGMVIFCRPIRNGYMKITDLGLIFDQTGTVNILIYDQYNNLYETGSYSTMAGVKKSNTVDIKLPCVTDMYGQMTYFIVYEVTNNKPLDNVVGCGCGGFDEVFDINKPYYFGNWGGSNSWANWAMAGGWQGDDMASFSDDLTNISSYANGISLNVEFSCNTSESFCDELSNMDNALAMCIALAVRYKAASLIASKEFHSTRLTRESFISKDLLEARAKEWDYLYTEKVTYLLQNIDLSQSDCLSCKPQFTIGLGKILN